MKGIDGGAPEAVSAADSVRGKAETSSCRKRVKLLHFTCESSVADSRRMGIKIPR